MQKRYSMKKIFLLILILTFTSFPTFSLETKSGGDNNISQLSIKSKTQVLPESYSINSETSKNLNIQNESTMLERANSMYSNPYEKKSVSAKSEKKFGKISVGNKSDTNFTPNEMTRTNSTYTKFEQGNFSVNTSYQNSATNFETSKLNAGSVSITPELKFNKNVSIQNSYSSNLSDNEKKNEIMFKIKPLKDLDRMNFDIGASQIYSQNSTPVRSQLKFQTKFNF